MGQECGVKMSNPFVIGGSQITVQDIRNELVKSRAAIDEALEKIDRYDLSSTGQNEMHMIVSLSGADITLTRTADMIRKRYV